ncbi:dinitrogenase iron-molybdenum cofactor biosynthesis protein [candidate division TA06 bacterium DG_24]|jgi:predicted Fe-Mo cluster-binding NifX family protein|uniref:Dinitrogenase iron-molybdenum cofactor biosynthesis protein n=3 Tax=Bacteria division TA06 TaxID=1156500 RepID=A0A0S8GBS4_UNCT6|nr:MAG: dinitrogenase iron-molybdenum cofactor biosynthesis protein [candidate division TA06 bacterium DG_24]KPK70579.1 MAG: dinitrogenase iron-molybdenum cofactor biosynthesis protein [candidate division TA06 bacterium SM23_40]
MKIGITSKGRDLDSPVDERFGRAAGFIIVELESMEYEWVDNSQTLSAPQGAGIQAAQNIAQRGVTHVITGHCGPKAFRTLAAGQIKVVVGATGTVREAIEQFRQGKLAVVTGPDKESHWA